MHTILTGSVTTICRVWSRGGPLGTIQTGNWEEYAHNPDSVMDVRQWVPVEEDHFYIVGGMSANQTVTNSVSVFVVDTVTVGLSEEMMAGIELRMRMSEEGRDHRIEVGMGGLGRVTLEVFDLNGGMIGKREVEVNERANVQLTDWLPGLSPGAYVLTARSGEDLKALKFVVWK